MRNKTFKDPIYLTRPLLPDLDKVMSKLVEIWESQWLTNNGPQHTLLEQRLIGELKTPYLSLFNNGTTALIVACRSLRLFGDVITTPFTFPSTPHVLAWNNIRPIFCDIDPVTMNIDSNKIEAMITPKTSGILAVHLFGTPCNVLRIQEVAERCGLKVIYDGAHAFGCELDGRGIGTFGDITMFSFHATKLFHTAEGGALTFNDPNLKAMIDLLKNFGIENEDSVVMPGINGKMTEIQAALGLLVLDCMKEEINRREAILETYRHFLQDTPGITFLPSVPGSSNQYLVLRINQQQFGISRDSVYQKFKEYNVFTRRYFYPLCSEYSFYRDLPSATPANLPVAHQVAQEVLCLPFYGGLTLGEVEQICDILLEMRP